VFADWLDEQGGSVNTAWAELIRVQVALARGAGAERERLTERDRELSRAITFPWPERLGIPQWLRWENWSRGFPLTVSGIGKTIREARPAFAGRIPLREFNLRDATDDDLEDIATWPELRLVRKLGVWTESERISNRGFLAVVRCPHLNNLERLRMQWVIINDAAVEELLDSPYMQQVISVKIVGGSLGLSNETRQRVSERFGQWDIY
jgi:hypothetical protein